MKILYYNQTGKIFYAVYDGGWFAFSHTTNIQLTLFEIDEIAPDNKNICIDLVITLNKKDINGLKKYYIENGELYLRDEWVEYIPEDF
jgi:hypothetical protein